MVGLIVLIELEKLLYPSSIPLYIVLVCNHLIYDAAIAWPAEYL
jgi:hypothetical protein